MPESNNYQHFFDKLEKEGMLVNSIHSLGWGFWPSEGGGYMDEHILRVLADEIERRNKPFWDEYEAYCKRQEEEYEARAADGLNYSGDTESIAPVGVVLPI